MIVPISFEHRKQEVRSHLIYNFSSVEDVILVTPVFEYPGIEIFSSHNFDLLYRRIGENEWMLDGKTLTRYPATVRNLNSQLEHYFSDQHFRFSA